MKRNNLEILMACDEDYFNHTFIFYWSFYMNDNNLSFNVIIDFDVKRTNFHLLKKDFRDKFNFIDRGDIKNFDDFKINIESNKIFPLKDYEKFKRRLCFNYGSNNR